MKKFIELYTDKNLQVNLILFIDFNYEFGIYKKFTSMTFE